MESLKELKLLAKQNKVPLTANGKAKTKKQLLEELKNTERQVKQIVIPPNSKETVINIYMTQNNGGHDIVERPRSVSHHIAIPSKESVPDMSPVVHSTIEETKEETPKERKARAEKARKDGEESRLKLAEKAKRDAFADLQSKQLREATEKRAKLMAEKAKQLEGSGIADWFKNAYSVVSDPYSALHRMPKQVADMLKKYGKSTVKEIIVCREPIKGIYKVLLEGITLGQFSREAKNYNYDDVFHLFAVLVLDNGKYLLTERNQRVVLIETTKSKADVKDFRVINANVNLNKLFEDAEKLDGKSLWRYDPIEHNCQNFITTLLKGSNLFTHDLDVFVNQETSKLLPKTSKIIARGTIDFASLAENVFRGGSPLNCWKGYMKRGTKMKNGKEVNNCVKYERLL